MSSPLIESLITEHGYPRVTAANLPQLLQAEDTLVLFLTGDPARYPEANDVAVILPELVRAFAGRFKPAVVDRALEGELKDRYSINIWPTLLFLRQGRYLGKIGKVKDWSEYLELIETLLAGPTSANPGIGIPVVVEHQGQHHG